MLPRSSIVTSRFTSTLRRASSREPVDRLTLTIAGSSCGVMPIAIASENSSASMSGRRERDVDHEDRDREDAGHPDEQLGELPQPDLERGRRPGGAPSPTAILPNAVAEPVATTTARAEPWWTTVPMKAHDGRSTAESRRRPARADFAAGIDSPVSTASSHSSWRGLQQAHVGRDEVADAQARPRRRARARARRRGARRRRASPTASWRMLACSAATARSERYSLTNPSPTLSTTIAAMIAASVGSPVAPETAAADTSRIRSGLRSWRRSTPNAVTRCVASTFGPNVARRRSASAWLRPAALVLETLEHLGGGEPSGLGEPRRRRAYDGCGDLGHRCMRGS